MEPRELWERHAVLAQAFCSSDDEVRRTQGLLDEAEARRSRTLAAFAVTVGSDAVVAELLGLDEREVRLARRTVGKEDARAVAKSLLAQTTREQPAAQQTATPPAAPLATPPTAQSTTPPAAQPVGPATTPPAAAPHASPAPQPHEPAWAPALDAVLMSSWHSGVDLSALATELGLDVRLLVARAQQLAAESRPVQTPPPDRLGRHRRLAHLPPAQQHESTSSTWRERPPQPPREPYEQESWKQQPYQNYRDQQEYQDYQEYRVYEEHPQQHPQHVQQHPQHLPNHQQQLQQNQQNSPHQHHSPHQQYQQASHPTWDANAITAAQHDWDGILSQWEATTSPTPPLSAPGQGGV